MSRPQTQQDPAVTAAWEKRIVLPATPDTPVYARGNKPAKTRLALLSKKRNAITDDDRWRQAVGITNLPTRDLPDIVPPVLNAMPATYVPGELQRFALYGTEPFEPRYLLQLGAGEDDPTLGVCLDFGKWKRAGRFAPLVYALGTKKTLYVSTAINGYAKEVGGKTGYLSALDFTGKLLWHAGPRLANAHNFVLINDVIVCGYGFTAEPDALFVLDATTGKTLQKLAVSSAPEFLHYEKGKLYVRCYDTDYVFAVR